MFPLRINHTALDSLPLPNQAAIRRVLDTLKNLVEQRITSYFRRRQLTDATLVSQVQQNLSIQRFEDDGNYVHLPTLSVTEDQRRTIKIHERMFDYLAFVFPVKKISGGSNIEDRKMKTFCEFLLRHELEHILYPEKTEHEVISSDVAFAMDWQQQDPTSYRLLQEVLKDELNGIQGGSYMKLLDRAERKEPYDDLIQQIITDYVRGLAEIPYRYLQEVFPGFETAIKARVMGECYRTTRSTSHSLVKRTSSFRKVLRLFGDLVAKDQEEAFDVFHKFKDRWGVVPLFHELDLAEPEMEEHDTAQLFGILRDAIQKELNIDECIPAIPQVKKVLTRSTGHLKGKSNKTLSEQIEEVRSNPNFPLDVLELIDKNKMNTKGQSGAKYTELIETLLAIPWNKLRAIDVSLEDFEQGLNRSHHGLNRPKEMVADFFANLIWRYRRFNSDESHLWRRTGSALLFVGPPGVGKTSLAISIAENLQIPYHKISLAGLRDEADIRGYGFTYEGSKPGPIVQGLIKMGVMNGMFILDEVDKTEQFAIATLLEILDPEQNHLFHDKYTLSTIDIDLSNAHFVLTANTLENVPPALIDRCQVIFLERYGMDEKVAIARDHLLKKIRRKYAISQDQVLFDPAEEDVLLRYIIRSYTFEAGVRDLERVLKSLFLRVHRREVQARKKSPVKITKEMIVQYLEEPQAIRRINHEDRIGEVMGIGVNSELGIGSLIPVQATLLQNGAAKSGDKAHISVVHATGNIEKVMDESRKVAVTAISYCFEALGIDEALLDHPVHIHFMGAATKKDGPSSGGAIALALASLFTNRKIRRDVAMTGEIDTQGRVLGIGGLPVKLETAHAAGCKTMIIPKENLQGKEGVEGLPGDFKRELQILSYEEWEQGRELPDPSRYALQVIAVDHILQAAEVAFVAEASSRKVDRHGTGERVLFDGPRALRG